MAAAIIPGNIAYYWNNLYPTPGGVTAQPYSTNQADTANLGTSGAISASPGSVMHAFVTVANDAGTQQAFTNWVVYSDRASSGSPDFTFLDRADDNSSFGSQSILQYRSNGPISGSRVFSLFDTLNFQNGRQQFIGLVVVEIKSAASNVPEDHNAALQSLTGTTTDSITCSATKSSGATQPALVLAASVNTTGLASPTIPAVGTGFTDGGGYVLFDAVNPSLRVEYRRVTGVTGSQAATFTPSGSDTFTTAMSIYTEGVGATQGRQKRRGRQGGLTMGLNLAEWF